MERVKRKVDIQYGLIGPSDGQSGGLAMLWKQDICLDIMGYSINYINAIVIEQESYVRIREQCLKNNHKDAKIDKIKGKTGNKSDAGQQVLN